MEKSSVMILPDGDSSITADFYSVAGNGMEVTSSKDRRTLSPHCPDSITPPPPIQNKKKIPTPWLCPPGELLICLTVGRDMGATPPIWPDPATILGLIRPNRPNWAKPGLAFPPAMQAQLGHKVQTLPVKTCHMPKNIERKAKKSS
jgi:hypothetical protein